jgi:hypothetical protein
MLAHCIAHVWVGTNAQCILHICLKYKKDEHHFCVSVSKRIIIFFLFRLPEWILAGEQLPQLYRQCDWHDVLLVSCTGIMHLYHALVSCTGIMLAGLPCTTCLLADRLNY